MTKFTYEVKLSAVLKYIEGNESFHALAKEIGTTKYTLRTWVYHYQHHGTQGLKKSYTSYSVQDKLDVLNYMDENGTSSNETAAILNIPSSSLIRKWRIDFEEGGIDALQPKKKGRRSMNKEIKKGTKIAQSADSIEALQEEVNYLRAENDYLKKLQALAQEKGLHLKKNRK
jgi:transposase